MIIPIVSIIAVVAMFTVWMFTRNNAQANKIIAEQRHAELRIQADKQTHEQYMETQRLMLPEPSERMLEVRLAEARAAEETAKAELQKQYNRQRY